MSDTLKQIADNLGVGSYPPLNQSYLYAIANYYGVNTTTSTDLMADILTAVGGNPATSSDHLKEIVLALGGTVTINGNWMEAWEAITAVPASPPVNSVLPVISGTAVVGSVLTTTDGTWTNSPTSFAYQWQRGLISIFGATNSTYTLVQADAGENITCVVTATNGAGSTPATSNILLIFDFDADAFFTRVTAASGTLTLTEQTATNTLVVQMKTDGIFTLMKAIYPMVGASPAACAQNLKDSNFTGSFSSGWTFASTGATPNGTSAFMDSLFVPSTNGLTYNNNHLSFYSRTSAQSGASQFYEMGSGNATGSNNSALFVRRSTNAAGYDSGSFTINRATFTNTNGNGFYCGTAPTTTSKYFKNGTSQVSKALTNSSISSINIYIGGFNENNATVYFSPRQCAFASMGLGLTDAEASNFYTAVQAFQTTLSRQV